MLTNGRRAYVEGRVSDKELAAEPQRRWLYTVYVSHATINGPLRPRQPATVNSRICDRITVRTAERCCCGRGAGSVAKSGCGSLPRAPCTTAAAAAASWIIYRNERAAATGCRRQCRRHGNQVPDRRRRQRRDSRSRPLYGRAVVHRNEGAWRRSPSPRKFRSAVRPRFQEHVRFRDCRKEHHCRGSFRFVFHFRSNGSVWFHFRSIPESSI